MNDNELLNKLYYKDLLMTGSNELYKKSKRDTSKNNNENC